MSGRIECAGGALRLSDPSRTLGHRRHQPGRRTGETLALVGPSGAGKSTLFDLLLRFFDPQQGRLAAGRATDRRTGPGRLAPQLCPSVAEPRAVLWQRRGKHPLRPSACQRRHEVEAAARAAHAHEFILGLPQGYATHLGEGGIGLSGGQRQRLAIAQALLVDAPVLLLDEATSALDAESEHLIQRALPSLMSGRTTLVIAHRLATVQTPTASR
ncbi:ATP-binding cassette domain-containing protein [Pseudomonas aeruginosa]